MNRGLPLKQSTSIARAAYDARARTLQIEFRPGRAAHRGGVYEYLAVPAKVVRDFLQADSLGRFVNWRIKPHYRHRRVA